MLKAVIFDLDGVVVSTDRYHYEAWKMLTAKMGLKFDEALNDRLRGVSRQESLHIILEANNRTVSQETFETMAEEKNNDYRNRLDYLSPKDILPGVTDLIALLRGSGIKTAIGSSSRNTQKILAQIKLDAAFDTVIDGNMISKSKPDPEIFIRCAKTLGEAPEECLVIEDAAAGIAAAKAAGMTALGIGEKALLKADAMRPNLIGMDDTALRKLHQSVMG